MLHDHRQLITRVIMISLYAVCFSASGTLAATADADRSGSDVPTESSDSVDRAKAARGGAGLRVGTWNVQDLPNVDGASHSRSPHYEGYFQKGFDSHLVLESTLGLWRWVQSIEEEGGPLSSDTREVVTTYVVPAFSTLKFYPVTRPGNVLEPYVKAGGGVVLGIEDSESSGSSVIGFSPGTSVATGFGLTGGLGVDWAFSRAFGLTVGGQYRWLRFSADVGGQDTYKGLGLDVGLTYRFRY